MATEKNVNLPDKEEVLNKEMDLLQGLIEAGNFKDDESLQRKIEIRRNGKLLFSFTVRPISEEEEKICYDKCTKRYPNPQGRKLPPIKGESDWVKVRSWKIYLATIDEDKARIWDNKDFQVKFDVLTGVDLIDKVLRTGDKNAICDVIDEISGSSVGDGSVESEAPTIEEYAKN